MRAMTARRARPATRPLALTALVLSAIACRAAKEQEGALGEDAAAHAPSLESAVAGLLASADLPAAVAELQLDAASFPAVLVPPYERLYPAYAAAFTAAAPAFLAELRRHTTAKDPVITVRRHYAGDAAISLALGRVRWAQPVQSESWLVSLGGALVDTAWVSHRGRWYILLGLDEAALAALAAQPACAAAARLAGRPGACSDAVWMALDGALRGEADRTARACDRAVHLCH